MTKTVLTATSRRLTLATFCVIALGCRGNAPAPQPGPALPAASPTGDAKVMLDLDYYEPMYLLNGDGRVIRLRLVWRHLPIPVMAEIGKLTELQILDLAGASVTDEGLAQLKDLQKLKNFGLGSTSVTDKGLVHLEKLEGLRNVWLSKQRISEEAAENLRTARPGLSVYMH